MSAFTLGHSLTWANNFQILWGHSTNLFFSHGHIHKQKNQLNLILQTVMMIANVFVTQMAQDQDLGVQGNRTQVRCDQEKSFCKKPSPCTAGKSWRKWLRNKLGCLGKKRVLSAETLVFRVEHWAPGLGSRAPHSVELWVPLTGCFTLSISSKMSCAVHSFPDTI